MAKKKKKEIIEWYDSPRFISNLMILLIFSIVICSQSFAIGDNYSLKLFWICSMTMLLCGFHVLQTTKINKKEGERL